MVNVLTQYPRTSIGCIALLCRIIPAYFFYGSCDVDAYASIIQCVMHNQPESFDSWNYIPTISLFLWITRFLAVKTSLPLAFCIKVIPIVFDSAIAWLLFEILKRRGERCAFGIAALYALCPVPIIVHAIHCQYESVFLFPLLLAFFIREYCDESYKKYLLFGALLGVSVLVKPVGLLFIFFMFVPRAGFALEIGTWWKILKWFLISASVGMMVGLAVLGYTKLRLTSIRTMMSTHKEYGIVAAALAIAFVLFILYCMKRSWIVLPVDVQQYLRSQGTILLGFLGVIGISLLVIIAAGFDLIALCDSILRYANRGPQGFGLPFAVATISSYGTMILKNRILLLLAVGCVAGLYYHQKITVFTALCVMMAVCLGLAGLCPNYCVWIIPFALLAGLYHGAVIYAALVTILYIVYYNPPSMLDWAFLFHISFAPLKTVSWLTPSPLLIGHSGRVILTMVGNWLIPLSCWYIVWQAYDRWRRRGEFFTIQKMACGMTSLPMISVLVYGGMLIVCAGFMFVNRSAYLGRLFDACMLNRYESYAMIKVNEPLVMRSMILDYDLHHPFFNCIPLIMIFLGIWLVYAWYVIRMMKKVKNNEVR